MSICLCNEFVVTPEGGIVATGSHTLTDNIISGGCTVGGTAHPDVPGQIWDAYVLVLPLDETGNGTSDEYLDRSPEESHGTGGSGDPDYTPDTTPGLICATAQRFDQSQWIDLPTVSLGGSWSITLWARVPTFYRSRHVLDLGGLSIAHNVIDSPQAILRFEDETEVTCWGEQICERDRWYHWGVVWDGSEVVLYVDGVEVGRADAVGTLVSSGDYRIGGTPKGGYLAGDVQEVRVRAGAVSADWIAADHAAWCGSLVTII